MFRIKILNRGTASVDEPTDRWRQADSRAAHEAARDESRRNRTVAFVVYIGILGNETVLSTYMNGRIAGAIFNAA